MKATLEIPDDLLIDVKIEAARQKKKLNVLVPELIRSGLDASRTRKPVDREAARSWVEEWVRMGREATRNLPPGPTAREILERDRSKLDRR